MTAEHPFSHPLRMHQVGGGVTRVLEADEGQRRAVAKWLDLQSLGAFTAELTLAPAMTGWTLKGRVRAEAVQSCGLTLAPLPVSIDQRFSVNLTEAVEPTDGEIEVSLDDDGADLIEDGQLDLGHHAVEQLALALDPFPRAPDAVFVPPEGGAEISPFAVLKTLKTGEDEPGS